MNGVERAKMNGAERNDAEQVTVLGFVGSLRRESLNGELFEAARAAMPAGVALKRFDELSALPHYDEDLDSSDAAAGAVVRRLRTAVADADALLFVTPEYNGTIPGALKNAVDWVSRPAGAGAIKGKPSIAIGASTGQFGGVWAQADLRRALGVAGARVLDVEFAVPRAAEAFVRGVESTVLVDGEAQAKLAELIESLIAETSPASVAEPTMVAA